MKGARRERVAAVLGRRGSTTAELMGGAGGRARLWSDYGPRYRGRTDTAVAQLTEPGAYGSCPAASSSASAPLDGGSGAVNHLVTTWQRHGMSSAAACAGA